MSKLLLVASIAILVTAGCSQNTQTSGTGGTQPFQISAAVVPVAGQVIITDAAGTPIPNASVQIGLRANVPFPGNVLTTDATGAIAIPAAWTDAQPVTVEAGGFVRTSWLSQSPTLSPAGLVLSLRRKINPQKV